MSFRLLHIFFRLVFYSLTRFDYGFPATKLIIFSLYLQYLPSCFHYNSFLVPIQRLFCFREVPPFYFLSFLLSFSITQARLAREKMNFTGINLKDASGSLYCIFVSPVFYSTMCLVLLSSKANLIIRDTS